MNPNTRVAVCGYSGDQHQIVELMPFYQQHECPITVLAPEDAPISIPGVDCRAGGKRCYIGWDGVERMKIHLRILLEYPEQFFLIHDADSLVLAPELPAYLYAEPDTVWSNIVDNGVPEQQPGFPADIPHLAFHPPWFLSRATIERLLAVGDEVAPNEFLPFIDYWMVEASVRAGLSFKGFEGRMSVPMVSHLDWAVKHVRDFGYTFIHSCKDGRSANTLMEARRQFLKPKNVRLSRRTASYPEGLKA